MRDLIIIRCSSFLQVSEIMPAHALNVVRALATALAVQYSHTAPNPPPPMAQRDAAVHARIGNWFPPAWAHSVTIVLWVLALAECAISRESVALNDLRAIWSGIAVGGMLLRRWCIRLLGPRFTLRLGTHGSSGLVTCGPYALVRHPSYLFGLVCCGAAFLSFLGPGSLLAAYLTVRSLTILWVVLIAGFSVAVWTRVPIEEDMLAREFDAEWSAYTRRVRSRIVPGVW